MKKKREIKKNLLIQCFNEAKKTAKSKGEFWEKAVELYNATHHGLTISVAKLRAKEWGLEASGVSGSRGKARKEIDKEAFIDAIRSTEKSAINKTDFLKKVAAEFNVSTAFVNSRIEEWDIEINVKKGRRGGKGRRKMNINMEALTQAIEAVKQMEFFGSTEFHALIGEKYAELIGRDKPVSYATIYKWITNNNIEVGIKFANKRRGKESILDMDVLKQAIAETKPTKKQNKFYTLVGKKYAELIDRDKPVSFSTIGNWIADNDIELDIEFEVGHRGIKSILDIKKLQQAIDIIEDTCHWNTMLEFHNLVGEKFSELIGRTKPVSGGCISSWISDNDVKCSVVSRGRRKKVEITSTQDEDVRQMNEYLKVFNEWKENPTKENETKRNLMYRGLDNSAKQIVWAMAIGA